MLIRQFRLGAHLALGRGDLVEVPAGRVERGEDVDRRRAARMPGGDRRRAAKRWCRSSTSCRRPACRTSTCSSFSPSSMPRRCRSAPAPRTSTRTRGRSACRSTARSPRWRRGGMHYGAAVIGLQWLALNRSRLARDRARRRRAMSAILVAVDGPQAGDWLAALRANAKGRELRVWPDAIGDAARHRLCLRLAAAARAAGRTSESQGDHQSRRRRRSSAGRSGACPMVPIARVAHPDLTMRVTEYVVLHVLMHHRRQRLYDAQQRERLWRVHDQPAASEVAVGVMGLGVIGRDAARALAAARLPGRGLEPHAEDARQASRRFTARPGSMLSWRGRKSWSACCRARATPRAF